MLDHVYEYVDYLSLHTYARNLGRRPRRRSWPSRWRWTSRSGPSSPTCDFVKAKKRQTKTMLLSFDEWNVWYHTREADRALMQEQPWQVAPPLCEEPYTLEDALVVGCMLITLLKHADRVKIACLAQLVNAIAPIATVNGRRRLAADDLLPVPARLALRPGRRAGSAGLQPRATRAGSSTACRCWRRWRPSTRSEDSSTLFAVNRGQEDALRWKATCARLPGYEVVEHLVLEHENPKAINTLARPHEVAPHARGDAACGTAC